MMETKNSGRPSKFNTILSDELCQRIGNGEPLAFICRYEQMPKVRTVSDWVKRDDKFSVKLAMAREIGFDFIAAECLEIANNPVVGVRTRIGKDGEETIREDMLGHRRLQIETRLKLLAKWDPKRYGKKLDVNANVAGEIRVVVRGDV